MCVCVCEVEDEAGETESDGAATMWVCVCVSVCVDAQWSIRASAPQDKLPTTDLHNTAGSSVMPPTNYLNTDLIKSTYRQQTTELSVMSL